MKPLLKADDLGFDIYDTPAQPISVDALRIGGKGKLELISSNASGFTVRIFRWTRIDGN